MNDTADILKALLARREAQQYKLVDIVSDVGDENPPFDTFTENLAYHWRRYERQAEKTKTKAIKPEAAVLRSIKLWLRKIAYIDVKRVSVGAMRTAQGFVMNFGGKKGESDLILTPHAGQPFERQMHIEVKRPDVIVDGKKVQRAGKQSEDQKSYQHEMEARGDKYVVVTSVQELRDFLQSLGFEGLPKCRGR
jgi:hypothetical protein